MQSELYYGFTMEYTPEQFPSEDIAQLHYLHTKDSIERHVRGIEADRNKSYNNEIILVPFGHDQDNNSAYIGMHYSSDNKPYFGVFLKEKDGTFSRYEDVDQITMANIPDEKWTRLHNRCVNGVTFKNCNIIDNNVIYYPSVDHKYAQSFRENNYTTLTAYNLVNELKKISESDIAYGPYGHSLRVAENMRRFAILLGKNSSEIEESFEAGLLHDIGKVTTPEEILNKPGKLSDKEYEIMQGHARFGAEILNDCFNAPKYVWATAALHHQQSRKYPCDCLSVSEIPEVAKIANIVDIYDSLINKRCYKKEMTEEKVIEIMEQDCREGNLDRKLFEEFKQGLSDRRFDFSEKAVKKAEDKIHIIKNYVEDKLYSFGIGKQEVKEKRERVVKNIDDFKGRYRRNILN